MLSSTDFRERESISWNSTLLLVSCSIYWCVYTPERLQLPGLLLMNRKPLGPFCRVFILPATDPGTTQGSKCVCSKVFCWRCYKPQFLPYLWNTDCRRLQGSVLKVPAQLDILAHSWRFKLTRCWAEDDQGLWAHITLIRNTGKYFTLILSKFWTWRNF